MNEVALPASLKLLDSGHGRQLLSSYKENRLGIQQGETCSSIKRHGIKQLRSKNEAHLSVISGYVEPHAIQSPTMLGTTLLRRLHTIV